jgi:hypothetical protein
LTLQTPLASLSKRYYAITGATEILRLCAKPVERTAAPFVSGGISGFRHEVYENCALLGHYAASSGNSLPTFRENLSV